MQDTIVVFDRIRENTPKYRGESFSAIADRSLMETIHRSLATQLNAIFIMVAILLFGGATMKAVHRRHVDRPDLRHLLLDLHRRAAAGRVVEKDLLGTKTKKPVEAPQPSLAS